MIAPAFTHYCEPYRVKLLDPGFCARRRSLPGALPTFGGNLLGINNGLCAGCRGAVSLNGEPAPVAEPREVAKWVPPKPKKRWPSKKKHHCTYCCTQEPDRFYATNKSICSTCRTRIKALQDKEWRKSGTRPKLADMIDLRQLWPGMWREGPKPKRFFQNGATRKG